LTECLTLAEPERYVRVFLDEGQPMQMLLAQWLAHASAGPLRDYAIHLLSHFDAEPHAVTAAQEKVSPTGDPSASHVVSPVEPSGQALVEPLSQRELEVLHLIALGRANKEIARQLFIAPGTVKAHTASIYRKLDVANRTEAVARARQLGILPKDF
jgi:LuxR family maltose regulon positive regulatory protein